MSLTRVLKNLVERRSGIRIFRVPPHGVDVSRDIARSFPGYRVGIVFDVGANVGQSAGLYLRDFPQARIHCFEPVPQTFRALQQAVQGNPRVKCVPMALGATAGKGTMAVARHADRSVLQTPRTPASQGNAAASAEVDIATLDDYCGANGIAQIHFLKIDTEGGDLDVLKGAEGMLRAQSIDFVEVEAGMNPDNTTHVPFAVLKDHLEARGYLLYGIYEQVHEWIAKKAHLRRADLVFVARRLIERTAP